MDHDRRLARGAPGRLARPRRVCRGLVANLGGYVRLADMLATTAFFSAFSAVVTYALTRVGEGLLHALLCVPPLSYLGMTRAIPRS